MPKLPRLMDLTAIYLSSWLSFCSITRLLVLASWLIYRQHLLGFQNSLVCLLPWLLSKMPSPLCFATSEHIAFKGEHKFHVSHEAIPYPHHLSHDELLIGTVHSTEPASLIPNTYIQPLNSSVLLVDTKHHKLLVHSIGLSQWRFEAFHTVVQN